MTKNSRPHDIIKAIKYHYGNDKYDDIVKRVIEFHNGIHGISSADMLGVIRCDLEHVVLANDPRWGERIVTSIMEHDKWLNFDVMFFGADKTNTQPTINVILAGYISALRLCHKDAIVSICPLPENDPVLEAYLKNAVYE